MSISIKESKVYRASDNTPFDTRELAIAHEKTLVRTKNLDALDLTAIAGKTVDGDDVVYLPDASDTFVVDVADLPLLIARNADAILAALTVKQERGPKPGSKKPDQHPV